MKNSPYLFQRILLITVCLLLSVKSYALEVYDVSPKLEKKSLATFLYYISDHNNLAIEQIIDASESSLEWQRNPKNEALNLGFQSDFFWFRTDLHNPSDKPIEKLLEVSYPLLDVVHFYEVKQKQVVNQSQQGNSVPFSNRIYDHRNFLYPINLEPGESVSIYMHIQGLAALQVPISLWDLKSFWQEDQWGLVIQAAYVGLMLIMMCYHLFLAWGTQDKMYLIYVGILASILVFISCYYGVAHQFFWPELTAWNARAVAISVPLNNLLVILFAMEVLSTRKLVPKSHQLLKVLTIILGCVAIGGATLPMHWMAPVYTAMVFIAFTALLFTCYRVWPKCQTEGRIFTTAYTVYLLGCLSMALNKFGMIPATTLTESFVQIGSTVETVLLSLALAARINRLREDSVKLMKAEIKAKEAELIAQQEINEGKAKTQFLAMMSHEIRTPMNGVLGLLDVLKSTRLNGKQTNLVDTIQSSGEILLTIINDVLDFSKADAQKLELERIPLNPYQLVEECALLYAAKTKQTAVPLLVYVSPTAPPLIQNDPTRLKQVIFNLLSNAFKFTERGYVLLKLDVVESTAGNRIRIEVHDTGIGITEEQKGKLFNSFVQANSSTTRKYGGTGLGLAISKKILEAMEGDIGVDSEAGKGSVFWLEFPIDAELVKPTIAATNVLVCTDYRRLGDIMSESCASLPFTVNTVSLDFSASTINTCESTDFDRCIIYNSESELDTRQFAENLSHRLTRKQVKEEIPTYIIEMDFQDALDSEASQPTIIPPPVFLNQILGMSSKQHSVCVQTSNSSQLPAEVAQLNILIADDNRINQMVIKGILTPMVKSIKIVSNGEEAFEEYVRNGESYDLIFMDCEMPVMDGYEASRRIRTYEKEKSDQPPIPIVALTAHALAEFKDKAIEAGMNDHLAKPVNSKLITQFFNQYINAKQMQANREGQAQIS